jgi:hypothetical protein
MIGGTCCKEIIYAPDHTHNITDEHTANQARDIIYQQEGNTAFAESAFN